MQYLRRIYTYSSITTVSILWVLWVKIYLLRTHLFYKVNRACQAYQADVVIVMSKTFHINLHGSVESVDSTAIPSPPGVHIVSRSGQAEHARLPPCYHCTQQNTGEICPSICQCLPRLTKLKEKNMISWIDRLWKSKIICIYKSTIKKYWSSWTQVKPRSAPLAQDEDLGEEGGGYAVPRYGFLFHPYHCTLSPKGYGG